MGQPVEDVPRYEAERLGERQQGDGRRSLRLFTRRAAFFYSFQRSFGQSTALHASLSHAGATVHDHLWFVS